MADQANNDVNSAVQAPPAAPQEPATPDSSTEENNSPEVADPVLAALSDEEDSSADKPKADTEKPKQPAKEDKEPQEVEQPKPEDTNAKDQPQGELQKRTEKVNAEIRDLVARKNALTREVEQLNGQVYQAQTPEELQDQGYSPEMAAIEQMRQEREIERYNSQVAEAQLTIDHESSRVLQDFPIFNPEAEQFKPELAQRAASLLQANLIYDPNTGQPIGSNVSPYQLYQTLAETYQTSAQEGQVKGQRATEKMLANADVTSNAGPSKRKVDPVLAVLESDEY